MPKLAIQIPASPPNDSGPTITISSNNASLDSDTTSDAGLLVLSSSMRILHINDRARTLLALFGEAYELWPNLTSEAMPAILTEFCGHVFAELRRQSGSHEWTEFEMRRVCHMVTPALLLRGFGMPSIAGQESRMILTLQPCTPVSSISASQNYRNRVPLSSSDTAPSTH